MRELSLHLMDIIENSITAKAKLIELSINEDKNSNLLTIKIIDNGCGMDSEMLNKVTDPFVTTRTTRKVGLGISLFKSACERCEGNLEITSEINKGTSIVASMQYNHIDRAPIGKVEDTIITVLLSEGVDLLYTHIVNNNEFVFDSREIKKIVGNELNDPEILMWLKEYLNENISNIGGGIL
jgi:signal transduction histidine kinase